MFRRYKRLLSVVALTSMAGSFLVTGENTVRANAPNPFEIQNVSNSETGNIKKYGDMPPLFELNKGQTDASVKFVTRAAGYTMFLTETGAVFSLKVPRKDPAIEDGVKRSRKNDTPTATATDTMKMTFAGANEHPAIETRDEAITKTNYYIGKKRFDD